MEADFLNWFIGITEDTPIPYEIKHIFFCLTRVDFYFYISVGGSEFFQTDNFDFYPLEAQFFDIKKYTNNFTFSNLKNLVQKAQKDKNFQKICENKKIYVLSLNNNIYYEI